MIKKPELLKYLNIISHFILISVIFLFIFKPRIMRNYYRFKFRSPIKFNNIRINFPKGIIFNKGNNSIVFNYWDNPNAFLHIGKIDLNKVSKDYLLQEFEKRNFNILEVEDIYFKGYESFTLSYIDTAWKYNKAIFIIPKNLRIIYEGTKENYSDFKLILENIEFL